MRPTALILLASAIVGTGAGRLPQVPDDGFDLRNLEHVEALAGRLAVHVVRLEGEYRRPLPYDPAYPEVRDGAGLCVAAGQLVTTADWLDPLENLRLVRRDGRAVPVRVERLDREAGLALLRYDPEAVDLVPVAGFASPPTEAEGASGPESVLVMPTVLSGSAQGVRQTAAGRADGGLVLSGAASNGVPAFDRHARVAALARRWTPDLVRSLAVSGAAVARWLESPPQGNGSQGPRGAAESRDDAPPGGEAPR